MDDITGYELSRRFWGWSFDNPEKIKPIHSAIYFFAIEHCNRLGWKEKFGFPSQMVMEAIGVKNWRTYSAGLKDLVDFNFIEMIEVSKNQYSSNIIAIVNNTKAHTKALDKALQKHGTKHSQSTVRGTVSINKQVTKNKEQRTKNLSDSVEQTFHTCLSFFPENLHPKNPLPWMETIDKLNRIDKYSFERIIEITKKTRSHEFWSKNFLSIKKLRSQNKEGVPYIVVFDEQTKPKEKKKTGIQIAL